LDVTPEVLVAVVGARPAGGLAALAAAPAAAGAAACGEETSGGGDGEAGEEGNDGSTVAAPIAASGEATADGTAPPG
jgi:hypothetical protein